MSSRKNKSIKIADKLYLIKLTLGQVPAKPVESPTNHVVAIDCSGSMHGELPQIREQLRVIAVGNRRRPHDGIRYARRIQVAFASLDAPLGAARPVVPTTRSRFTPARGGSGH